MRTDTVLEVLPFQPQKHRTKYVEEKEAKTGKFRKIGEANLVSYSIPNTIHIVQIYGLHSFDTEL